MAQVAKTIDVRGKVCPIPVMETAKAINDVPVGGILEILATDPAAEPDIKAWASRMGHEVVGVEKQEGYIRILVKRLK